MSIYVKAFKKTVKDILGDLSKVLPMIAFGIISIGGIAGPFESLKIIKPGSFMSVIKVTANTIKSLSSAEFYPVKKVEYGSDFLQSPMIDGSPATFREVIIAQNQSVFNIVKIAVWISFALLLIGYITEKYIKNMKMLQTKV